MSIPNQDRLAGGIWGAVTGDALGVPVEFQTRQDVQRNPVTGMRGYGTHRQPPGTWSDDSSLLLTTLESLTEKHGLDTEDIGHRFVLWERSGHWTPHGDVFDIGITTSHALSRIASGTPAELAGGADVMSNGNGSLMRILPVSLWFREDGTEHLLDAVHRVSAITHRHPRSQMACGFYAMFARELLAGAEPSAAYQSTLHVFREYYQAEPFHSERLNFQLIESGHLAHLSESEVNSSGYVMHTLAASIWCLLTSATFEDTVLKAVNLGYDTDTTGCVAGGLAGIHYGCQSIPETWLSALAKRAKIETLTANFLAKTTVAPARLAR